MGHIHLGVLPKTKKWHEVAKLLADEAADEAVIAASAHAAEKDLLRAADSPVYIEAVRLLLAIPYAARSDGFAAALREADLDINDEPGLLDLMAAVSSRLDTIAQTHDARSDFGELSARALAQTLSISIGDALPGLFDATAEDVKAAAKRLSWSNGISDFSRSFFGNLVTGSLSYWLDRSLSLHIGEEMRFSNAVDRSAFDMAMTQYTSEVTRIIKEFSGGWYGKTLYDKAGFERQDAAIFGAVALKKVVSEMRLRRGLDE